MKSSLLAGTALFALMFAPAAFAQAAIVGTENVSDRIEDIEGAVAEDMARAEDASRFSNPEFRPGLSGSASLGYSGKSGNNKSQDLSVGIRLRYAQGNLVQTLGAAMDFQETAGAKSKEDILAVYDANYYFDQAFYGFVLARIETDGLGDKLTAQDIANGTTLAQKTRRDAFIGFGPGYRVVNTPDMAWRVQAGVGISYLEDGNRTSTTETGYLAASRFFYKVNDNLFVTNDTDILKSDKALRINNDLGMNVKVTDAVSTRVSYLTEYNDSRPIRSDNKLGVSLVFGF